MASKKRKAKTGIQATQFQMPNTAPPLPEGFSLRAMYDDLNVEMQDGDWIVEENPPDGVEEHMTDTEYQDRYEDE